MWFFKTANTKLAATATDINQFDLAFVVDTTGSMGGLIADAQRHMIEMINRLTTAGQIDLQLGVVEYRDHPPQDSMIYRVYPLTGDLEQAKKAINKLRAQGGGDEPEAVLAGVVAACQELKWRRHARRIAVLVGDAPPHGVGFRGDAFRNACPSGETVESVSAKSEERAVTLYAMALTQACRPSFEHLSRLTGGDCFTTSNAIEQIQKVLKQEFGQLDFDRQVHDAWLTADEPTTDGIADQIGATPPRVAAAVSRLRSRGFLTSAPAVR
jgi:Mg-chelatase subunit ChlD